MEMDVPKSDCYVLPHSYFNKSIIMHTPKMILSFALNPITNNLEFVTVPEIDFKPPGLPKIIKSK